MSACDMSSSLAERTKPAIADCGGVIMDYLSRHVCSEKLSIYSEERNVLQLLSRLIGLPQNDVKVSLTQGSLAFRVERDLFSGCDCRITTRHA